MAAYARMLRNYCSFEDFNASTPYLSSSLIPPPERVPLPFSAPQLWLLASLSNNPSAPTPPEPALAAACRKSVIGGGAVRPFFPRKIRSPLSHAWVEQPPSPVMGLWENKGAQLYT